MSTRAEKRALRKAAGAHVEKMIRLSNELKSYKLSHRIQIAWYILTRSNWRK